MLILSLGFFHVSNIAGYFEDLTDKENMGYQSLGLKRYDNTYIEYPIGHLFFIIVMFLINSLYTAEALKLEEIGSIALSQSGSNEIFEMEDMSKINKLKESILPKDNNNDNNNDNKVIQIREKRTISGKMKILVPARQIFRYVFAARYLRGR